MNASNGVLEVKRRRVDAELHPAEGAVMLLSVSIAERESMVDALVFALAGPARRAGDADRWRALLRKLGAKVPSGT